MGDTKQNSDIDFITALAKLLRKNELTEIEVTREYGDDDVLSVRVAREIQAAPMMAAAPVAVGAALFFLKRMDKLDMITEKIPIGDKIEEIKERISDIRNR